MGKRIVKELGPERSVDTLSRWIAHYIAELIQAAETASGDERQEKMAACVKAIEDLWQHRAYFPKGQRPFEELDPILQTLESLDLNAQTFRYYPVSIEPDDKPIENAEARKWLAIAKELDYSARILIRYCLASASENAVDKSEEWVALAEAAGADNGAEFSIIRLLTSEADLLNAETPNDKERRIIENRITRLDQINEMISQLVGQLRERIK